MGYSMITLRKRIGSLGYSIANLALGAEGTSGRPIFVTGNGRSGTSWIGQGLGRAENLLYYREPCHPKRNGLPSGPSNEVWCRYLHPGERDSFFEYTLGAAFRGHFWRGSGHSYSAYRDRIGHQPQVLVKEVASFLSLEWVVARWQPQVLVILRHPGAYAASVRALNQDPEEVTRLRLLCRAPALREDHLGSLLPSLERIDTPLAAAVASWGIRTRVALRALERHPDWGVVHYEDVARDPETVFRALYARFGLPWTAEIADWIRAKASSESKGLFSTSRVSQTRIDAWRGQLTRAEAMNVRQVLEPFELPLYGAEADWDGPYRDE